MVTEGLPIPCSTCYEATYADDRPNSSSSTPTSTTVQSSTSISEALRRLNLDSHRSTASSNNSDQDEPPNRAALRRATQNASISAFDTPPLSPRHPFESASTGHGRRESSYKRTYDETTTKRAGPCENCAMTLPKRQGSGSARSSDTESENGPTLRTRAPYARAYGSGLAGSASPPNSTSTASDDEDADGPRPPFHRRTATITSTTSRSSASSSPAAVQGHTHYQYYTSTHEPVVPSSFSIVRASCIRTLSFETLPRALATTGNTPTPSPATPNFVTTQSTGASSSGGPIFFGDPSAGYTTAYIFRIPDLQARGHKRVYAFLALSTHRERLAMKTFTFVSTAFRELAAWVLSLAEAEAERASDPNSPHSASGMYAAGAGPMGMTSSQPQDQSLSADCNTGSGFLASGMGGLSRRMGAGYGGYGYGGSGSSTKPKGLPELVGMPDFFLELHQKFVQLLLELGLVLSA
ncbi:unnamed protein product [Discula destructiva]